METQMKSSGSERTKSERRDGAGLGEAVEAMFGPAPGTLKGPARNSSQWRMEESPCRLPAALPLLGIIKAAVPHNSLGRWAPQTAEAFLVPYIMVGCPTRHPF